MPAFGESAADEVRRATDIADIVAESVQLSRRGKKLWGLCPFHGEKTPSFTVDPEQQLFYCFGCHKGGNVFTFVMERDHRTFPEALELLAERAGVVVAHDAGARSRSDRRDRLYNVLRELQSFYRGELRRHPEAGLFLERRGLDAAAVDDWGLGYAPDEWTAQAAWLRRQGFTDRELIDAGVSAERPSGGVYDRIRGRVTFPIADPDGRIVGFGGRLLGDGEPKYLNSPETAVYHKGRILYGADRARSAWRDAMPVLVEGYFDVIAFHRAGVKTAVASLGTALTDDHARYLRRFGGQVLLAYDNDAAGREAALRAFQILARAGLTVFEAASYDAKDVDELFREHGAKAVGELAAAPVLFLHRRIQERVADVRRDPAVKAVALRELRPLLLAIDDPVERQGHVELVERLWAIERRILAQALRAGQGGAPNNGRNFRHNMVRQPEKIGLYKDEVNLLAGLIQFPDQMEGVLTSLPELCKDVRWQAIVSAWDGVASMPAADWVGSLPEGARELASEALLTETPITMAGLVELTAALGQRREEARWQELMRRAATGAHDPALEQEIRELWPHIQRAKQRPRKEG
ncbi:MAG: DNA primase [Clostridia bacterium]